MRSKKVIYNISTNLVLQFVVIIYGLIVPRIIIGSYGSNVNGLISSITQFLSYIALLDSGFTAVVKSQLYKPIAEKNKKDINLILKASNNFFRVIAYILVIYTLVLSFVYPLIVNTSFGFFYTFGLIIILSISSFSEYYFGMVYRMYLQAEQKSYIISLIQILTYIVTIIITLILAKSNVSIHVLKLFTSFAFVLRPFLQNIYVRSHYKINLKNVDSSYKIKNRWDGFAQHIAYVVHSNTDITLLTLFSTLTEVSVYSVYYLVIKGIKSLIQAFVHGIDASFGDMIAKEENNALNKNFKTYETLFNFISVIGFSCTLLLIVPFVSVYTKGITDANYIRYLFGMLLVISEYIWAFRQPYNELVKAAGHFKETRTGSLVECFSNIIVSVILIFKYGIVGVAIGTIIAMTLRSLELIYHSNKYILKRSHFISIKNIVLVVVQTVIIVLIVNAINLDYLLNYKSLVINAIIVFAIASLVSAIVNYIFNKEQLISIANKMLNIVRRKNEKN